MESDVVTNLGLQGIAIARRNFTLSYDTNIPRQVGLAGSSAIVTATFRCLMKFFKLTDNDIPKEMQPNFILQVRQLRHHFGPFPRAPITPNPSPHAPCDMPYLVPILILDAGSCLHSGAVPDLGHQVEKSELGINAGLQDRVIQIYNGLVFMNFDEELLTSRGYGGYS